MGVALAGSMKALSADDALLSLTSRACTEGVELARRIGRPEAGAMLGPLLATPLAMRAIVGGLERFSPEALFYIDEHFGRKLMVQHRLMAHDIAELARAKDCPHRGIDALALRLDSAAGA
jgi:hypothetical protein